MIKHPTNRKERLTFRKKDTKPHDANARLKREAITIKELDHELREQLSEKES